MFVHARNLLFGPRQRQRTWVRALAGLALAALPRVAAGDGDEPEAAAQLAGQRTFDGAARGHVLLSASRRFMVGGLDQRENLRVSVWAETVDSQLQSALGFRLLGGEQRGIRFLLFDQPDSAPSLHVEEYRDGDGIVHRLTVVNLVRADYESFRALFCQVLLRRHVLALARQSGAGLASAGVGWPENGGLPEWVTDGLAQNTLPDLKSRNLRLLAGEWQRGRLPPAGALLNPNAALDIIEPDRDWAVLRRRAAYGTWMLWLLSFPERGERLAWLFERLAAGETPAARDLVPLVPGVESPGDMDARWDEWMLRQAYVLRLPGESAPENVRRLEWELLLYPGRYGIPMTGRLYEKLEWEDLIDRREEPWIGTFAQTKAAALRLAAVGRGAEIEAVAEAFAGFLDTLRRERREDALRERLAAARARWQRLAGGQHGPPRPTPELRPEEAPSDSEYDSGHGLGFAP